jgi:hypothetical protein
MRVLAICMVLAAIAGCFDFFAADPNAVVQCNAFARQFADAPTCDFNVTNCADESEYKIVCSTETACVCTKTPAEGEAETKAFTAASDCSAINTDDVGEVDTFFNANCGWNITSNTF